MRVREGEDDRLESGGGVVFSVRELDGGKVKVRVEVVRRGKECG